MKVLLINPLIQKSMWEYDIIARQPSCGLLYLAAYLRKFGHKVKLFERKFAVGLHYLNQTSLLSAESALYEYLKEYSPQIVGITATTSQVKDAFRCAMLVKAFDKDIRVIIGGAHPSAEPESSLKECNALDAACIGEGENTMLEFTEGKTLEEIRGISFWSGRKIIVNERRPVIENIDTIPFPARDLLNHDFYFSPSSTTLKGVTSIGTTVFTERGCSYNCSFCQNPMLKTINAGRFVRCHSVDYVASEIGHIIERYNVNAIFFLDPLFTIDKNRAIDICDMLIRNGFNKKINYEVTLRANCIDEDVLKALKESGCTHIIYGLESASSRMLKMMNKGTTVEDNQKAVRLTKKYGISCVANFILGIPGETDQDFMETLKFIKMTKPNWVTRHKFYPLPGTPFYNKLLLQKKIEFNGNWDNLYDRAVLSDFTFADMDPRHFKHLCLVLDRRLALPINYLFKIRANIKKYPLYSLRQFILMVGHILTLYLPCNLRKIVERLAENLQLKSKYVYE